MSTVVGFARKHPTTVDSVFAALLFITLAASPGPRHEQVAVQVADQKSPLTIAMLLVVCAALAVRRKWPLWTLAITTIGSVPAVATGTKLEPFLPPLVIAAYTVSVLTDRWTTLTSAIPAALFLGLAVVVLAPTPGFTLEALGRFAWIGMAIAVGQAVRNRRANIAAVHERAVRAEQTREEEARRRVVEERLHIARELHDVVAHHIAVINVQAGVAEHLIDTKPDAAAEALRHVRRSSRAVLDELSGLLSVLRKPEDPNTPTEPAPGLAQLDGLIETFRASGLSLEWTVGGKPQELSATADLVAYRVLQEALTNAHRHGTDSASLSVLYSHHEVVLEVANEPGKQEHTGGSGLGLLGMRERASAVGGTMRAGIEADGRFRVHVALPLQVGENS
jgi:signal transduction histidine kinase